MKRTAGKSLRTRKAMEQAIHLIFLLCGIVAVGFVLCISVYLVISGLMAAGEILHQQQVELLRQGIQMHRLGAQGRRLGVHCGWIIVLVLVVVMHLYMNYTKHGYEIAVIGDSLNTARYAGMNVGHVMMRTMFLSGAISGLVGFIVASGANNTLYDGVANGVGFTSITVAWLSQLNAFAMIVISALLAILEKGAETLQTAMQVPTSISDIVTGILLFCMLGCEFFINYRMIFRRKQAEAPAAPAAAESDQTESKEDASC